MFKKKTKQEEVSIPKEPVNPVSPMAEVNSDWGRQKNHLRFGKNMSEREYRELEVKMRTGTATKEEISICRAERIKRFGMSL